MKTTLKLWVKFFALFVLFQMACFAQFTTVTGTVTDPSGIPYAFGTISPILVFTGGTPKFSSTGTLYFPPTQASGLDINGKFIVTLADNTTLTPAATKWNFTVCSGAGTVQPAIGKGPVCFSLASPITISGASQDISTNLNAVSLALTVSGAGLPTLPTSPNGVPETICSTPSGGVAGAAGWCLAGIPGRTVAGTSDTIAVTDRSSWITYTSGSAVAVTLPQAGSSGFGSNFAFGVKVEGVGAVTITPTTSTIGGNATLVVNQGENCTITSYDNANYVFRCAPGQLVAGTNITLTRSASGMTVASTASGTTINPTNNAIPKRSNATTFVDSCFTDDGTNATCSENIKTTGLLSAGTTPAASVAGDVTAARSTTTGALYLGSDGNMVLFRQGATNTQLRGTQFEMTTAGAGIFLTEGTPPSPNAGESMFYVDSTAHDIKSQSNGSALPKLVIQSQPSPIHSTGNTAAITTATLCASAAGACNQAGQYHVHWDFIETGTACSNVTAGSVTFLLTWTDSNATVHSAVSLQMMNQTGAATTAMGSSFTFATALANAGASGDFNISTNGSVIQYATGYTACTTGTGTYQLDASATRLQ